VYLARCHQDDRELEQLFCKLEDLGLFILGKKCFRGDLTEACRCLPGG